MTVLVGVACQDGVIIGTDSAMTSMAGPMHRTVQETDCEKIDIHFGEIITATTGAIGLAQRFRHELETLLAGKELDKHRSKAAVLYATEVAQKSLANFQKTISPQQQHPHIGLGIGALMAFVSQGRAHLVEFEFTQFHPELKGVLTNTGKPATRPYVTMGGGQPMADPFIAHASRMLFGKDVPMLSEARLLVAWTLQHVIAYNTGGVAGEMQISVLDKNAAGKWSAHALDVGEVAQQVMDIEKYIGAYWTSAATAAPDLAAQLNEVAPPAEGGATGTL
jgi:hypothetical protein